MVDRGSEASERTTECLRLIERVAIEVNEERPLEQIVREVLDTLCTFLGWSLGHAYLVGPGGGDAVPLSVWRRDDPAGEREPFVECSDSQSFVRGMGLPGRVVNSGTPEWIVDLRRDVNYPRKRIAVEVGLRSAVAFPLRSGDQIVGVLELYDDRQHDEDPILIDVLQTIGLLVGRVIERTRHAAALAEAESLSRLIVDTAIPAFVAIDERGVVIQWSPSAERIFGWAAGEVLGQNLTEVIVPEHYREAHKNGLRRYLDTGEARILGKVIEVAARCKDGREIPVELSINALETSQGRRFNAFLQDISSRVDAAERLQRRERQLAEAQAIAHVGSWEWTVATDDLSWSAELHRIYGTDPAVFLPTYASYSELIHPDDRAAMKAVVEEALAEGRPYSHTHRIVRPDGTVRHVHARGAVVRDAADTTVRLHGTGHDVTELIAAEEQERQLYYERKRSIELEQLTAALERSNGELERFAYIVSHDLKAPLRGIAQTASWLVDDLGDGLDEENRRTLTLLQSRVHRMTAMIDGILAFSRAGREEAPREEVAIAALVGEIVDLLAPPPNARIEIAPDLPTIVTERYRLWQVLHNLVDNALKYADQDQPSVVIEGRTVGDMCELSVSDDGPGIPPAQRARVFELFRTLRPAEDSEGTGIGLSLVKKIVELQGGEIAIEDAPAGGTRVRFTWPAATSRA